MAPLADCCAHGSFPRRPYGSYAPSQSLASRKSSTHPTSQAGERIVSLKKQKVWALAMMAAAVLVTVILLNPPKLNQLTVRLVDEDTKKPIDGKVRIWEHRPFPVLS